MSQTLHIVIAVVYSDWNELVTNDYRIRTVEDAANLISQKAKEIVLKEIGKDQFCSVVIGIKKE